MLMLVVLLGLIGAVPAECRAEGFSRAAEFSRVVIIGFDGADARLVERYMQEGKLPHLQKLRDDGGYAPLMPTNPPQTPVSWSAFATGKNPGKTGIFDFLKRLEPGSYLPTLAFTTETRRPFLWGPRNALRWASRLCEAYRPTALIGLGVAGALTPTLSPLELVASKGFRNGSGDVPLPDGDDPVMWDHLGDVYHRLMRLDEARAAWRRALDLYDQNRRRKTDDRYQELLRKLGKN